MTLPDSSVTPFWNKPNTGRMVGPKPRMGARGAMKVKTGCQTCKIRHKKCDEARPSCSQCSSTGRRCDLNQSYAAHQAKSSDMPLAGRPGMSLQLLGSGLPPHLRNFTHAEASHFDYFRLVSARDFALCFESALWESLLLRSAHLEPSICHAALAIAALSRHQYSPKQVWDDTGRTSSAIEFCILHYNVAIQVLNKRLRPSIRSSELAVLASILFIHIEAFQEFQNSEGTSNLISAHLNGGLAIVHNLKSMSQNIDHLETALDHIRNQIEQFEQFSA
ncbi:hypothetical protein L207DRAFT_357 [Hyaloscypha variabilis F]|uniref:Zn(2)-C6 fungal-type domain-containing protein n=1 Tax=Hyaloscypha variabilis (strain UAMH 11265 / GT02V1 / F) TaxID=1149755 RepID=A0A2J6SB79_HYAVF|nr:hypothetical protein L207DRAFT_357 [Hyaloscypha variabilis F]